MSIKFDLEAALAGAPVQTVNGMPVDELHLFNKSTKSFYPLYGTVHGSVHCWTADGIYARHKRTTSDLDLRMAPKKITQVMNLYRLPNGGYCACLHASQPVAQQRAGLVQDRIIARIPVEFSEGQGLTPEELKELAGE